MVNYIFFVLLHISNGYGHAKPETSMINTHVAKKDLLAIQSLLDSILLNLNKNDKREQISCYPETQLYKQELYSSYNQLCNN
jgi:hypothetical protein